MKPFKRYQVRNPLAKCAQEIRGVNVKEAISRAEINIETHHALFDEEIDRKIEILVRDMAPDKPFVANAETRDKALNTAATIANLALAVKSMDVVLAAQSLCRYLSLIDHPKRIEQEVVMVHISSIALLRASDADSTGVVEGLEQIVASRLAASAARLILQEPEA